MGDRGQLYPEFRNGKLVGFHRRKNDAPLMFRLRHYGQDGAGRRTTINYFSTRASAGASGGGASASSGRADVGTGLSFAQAELVEARAGAEASTTPVRTVINGGDVAAAAEVPAGFEGVALDAEAHAAIAAALEARAPQARPPRRIDGGRKAFHPKRLAKIGFRGS